MFKKIPDLYKGIFCIIASAFGFAMMNIFVRLSGDLPSMQKCIFRNLVASVISLVVLLRSGEKITYHKEEIPLLLTRSLAGTLGIFCNFYAVDHLAVADATLLNKLAPFFTLFFSFLLLKEKMKPFQFAAALAAFIGVLFVIKPVPSNMYLFPSLIGALGGLSAGFAYTIVRILGLRGTGGSKIVLFFSAFSTLFCIPFVIADHVPMTGGQLICLLLAGASATVGQYGVTFAYRFAPSREISIYDYSQIIFAAILGFFILHQLPDIYSIIGYIIIIGAGLYMFLRQKRV